MTSPSDSGGLEGRVRAAEARGLGRGPDVLAECEAEGQTVSCIGEIKLDKIVVPADKYGAFREALTKLQAYERRIVLLEKS